MIIINYGLWIYINPVVALFLGMIGIAICLLFIKVGVLEWEKKGNTNLHKKIK